MRGASRRSRWLRALEAGLLVSLLLVPQGAAASASPGSEEGGPQARAAVPGEIIVGFQAGVPETQRVAILASVGASRKATFAQISAVVASVPAERADAVIKRLSNNPQVRYAEPNHRLFADDHASPNDPSFHELWGLHNFDQSVNGDPGTDDADIDALEAWAGGTRVGSDSVVVATIDTGVDFSHPDLAPQRWINAGENCDSSDPTIVCAERTNNVDDDGNGYVDDYRGWDFVNGDNDPFDDNGHGTHVSGTIGAVGNDGVGVAGVNWTVKIMALKFLGAGGSGSTADAVAAVLYSKDMGAHVSNNSWGGGGFNQSLLDAINSYGSSGGLFVAAAGNSGVDTDATPHYPSSYDSPYIVAVAATDNDDNRASFSNYGANTVDLGAPGVNIYSTYPGSSYRFLNGTSMATPHVAGTAALVRSVFQGATNFGIQADLYRSVDPNTALNGRTTTGGRLNANNAVSCANAPRAWIGGPRPGFEVSVGEPIPIQVIGANCASPAGLASVSVTANGVPVAVSDGNPDTGLYTGSYTPAAAGPITIEATVTVGGTTDTRTATGAAAENYTCDEDASFSWDDPTLGTNLGIASDDTYKTVSLPFAFTFFGQSYNSMAVSSNGFLQLGSTSGATAYANTGIPYPGAPNGIVAPFWDDLYPGNPTGAVYARMIGTTPNRRFVVGWVDVPHYSNVGAATFEAILYEGTNEIRFQYLDTDFGNTAYNSGASATAGVEGRSGSMGRQHSLNQAVLTNGKAIRCWISSTSSPPTITTSSLADGTTGVSYDQTLTATGGTPPYTWSISAGSLPADLTLDPVTGTIRGTPTSG